MTADRWLDLLLNVITEALGILVTIFLVDRIIKKREEARWKPTKNLIYYRLTGIAGEVFLNFCPAHLYKDIASIKVSFGSFSTNLIKDFSSIDVDYFALYPVVTKELPTKKPEIWFEEQYEMLVETDLIINEIIHDATTFLEPEELSLIFELKDAHENFLAHVSNMRQQLTIGEKYFLSNKRAIDTTVNLIITLLSTAHNLEIFLLRQSTKRQTLDEINNEKIKNFHIAMSKLAKQNKRRSLMRQLKSWIPIKKK